MKTKNLKYIAFLIVSVISVLSLGFNIYFLATRKEIPPSASGLFYSNIESIVEVKAESENIGESFGTAEFISNDGLLVTNAHVVTYTKLQQTYAFDKCYIRFANEEDYIEVSIIKYDTNLDIAVLKLDETLHKFKPIKISNSSNVKTGQKVYAIGNSANYGLSMAEGIVGLPLINIEYSGNTKSVIQANINITDGNSGGALLNENGELIGITTFRTKDLSGNVIYGISYSIPISTVLEYIKN